MEANYNEDLDVLTVEKKRYEDFGRNIESGCFIVDLDSDDEFLGLEIVDISQKLSIDKTELEKIQDAEVKFEKDEEVLRIELVLWINDNKNIISSQHPLTLA